MTKRPSVKGALCVVYMKDFWMKDHCSKGLRSPDQIVSGDHRQIFSTKSYNICTIRLIFLPKKSIISTIELI